MIPQIKSAYCLAFIVILFFYSGHCLAGGYLTTAPNPENRSLNTSYKVGATPGALDVAANGSATYSIPLFVSPGTAGMQPQLSINYNSNGGFGELGKGWALGGLSAIYRVPSDCYHDGITDPVDFDTNDAFVLDGARLVKDGSVYKTEQENFAVITPTYSGSAITQFTVKTKDGKTIEYGTGNGKLQNSTNSRYFAWYITKVQDAFGNYMTYTYANDATNGIRLTAINYTGNATAGLATYNSVSFTYITRNDPRSDYVYGQEVKSNLILTQVKSLAQGSAARTYDLNYIEDDGVSLLAELIETGSDGTRYNSTIFSYHGYQGTGLDVYLDLDDSFTEKEYGDLNGDGRTDLFLKYGSYLKYYTTNATDDGVTLLGALNVGTSYFQYAVGDFTGDGLDDLAVASSSDVKFYRSSGNGFTYMSSSDVSLTSTIQKLYANDVDGDCLSDLIIKTSSNLYVYKGDVNTPFSNSFYGTFGWGDKAYFHDFTGDGKKEIAILDGSESRFYQFNNTGYSMLFTESYGYGTTQLIFGDFNGDGKMDFIHGYAKNGKFSGKAYIADGVSFKNVPFVSIFTLSSESIAAIDTNGDGIDEIFGYSAEAYPIDPDTYNAVKYQFNGTGFDYIGNAYTYVGERTADFNGDGILDAFYLLGNNLASYQFFHRGKTKQRLRMVADGLNNKSIVNYKCITDNSVYTANSAASAYPYANFNGPLYVVSQVQQSNGLGAYFTTNYSYKGGVKFNPLGSFAGFLQTDATSSETLLVQRTEKEFHASLPTLTKVTSTVLNGQGSQVSQTESDFSVTALTFKRFKRHLQYNDSWDYLNNSGTSSTRWVDSYGNVTHEQTATASGSATTDTYYENYTTVAGAPVPNVPQTVRTVRVQDSKPSFEQKVTMSFNAANGFMTSKVIEPNKTNPLTITYIPVSNGLGLVWKEQLSGADFTTRETINQWDTQGRFITKQWAPEGQVTETTYDAKTGNATQVKYPAGYTDVSTYDGFGRLTYNKASDQTISLNWYSGSLANCVYYSQATGVSHPQQSTYFDRLVRELETRTQAFESGKEMVVSKSYNTKGQTATVSAPYFSGETAYNTVLAYDGYGRLTEENYANNTRKTTYAYTAGQVVTTNAAASPARSETRNFNDLGQLTGVTDTRGNQLSYAYHSSGQVETVSKTDGSVSTQFDAHGRPQQVSDPDLGTISYTYYATGELKSQTKNGKTTSVTYNRNGQVKTVTENEGTTTYNYSPTTGLLSSVSGINNTSGSFGYDGIGRLTSRTEVVDGVNYVFGYAYTDSYTGRLSKTTYPGNFAVTCNYSNGYLWEMRNFADDGLIWQLQETSPMNQVEKYKNGNNLVTTRTFDYKTGMVNRIQTGSIQDWQYSFDATTSNLNWRKDNKHGLQENFGYDNLDRLTSITFGGNTINIGMAENGNITGKDGLGTYEYTAPQPHAMSALVPTTGYAPEEQTATYTSFDKLKTLVQGTKNLAITYGYDHGRRKTVYTEGSTTKTKIFIPGGYEKLTEGGTTREFYYISTPAGLTSVYEKVNGTGAMYYIHSDNLGSVNFVTNSAGSTVQELGFDAWGRQRNAANWTYSSLPAPRFDRGYTGHEHLAGFDLINMNGRMYDPMVGRFLSADPALQAPGNFQNYNRYSYCLNNPLKYTDPSGYQYMPQYPLVESSDKYSYGSGSSWMANFGEPGYGDWAGLFSDGVSRSITPHLDRARAASNQQYMASVMRRLSDSSQEINAGFDVVYIGQAKNRGDGTFSASASGDYWVFDVFDNSRPFIEVASSQGGDYGWIETGFSHTGKTAYVAGLANKGRGAVEWEYLRQAKFNRSLSGNFSQPVKHSLRAISKTGKVLGVAGTVATYGVAGYQVATGTDNTSTWVDVGVTTGVVVVGIISAPVAIGAGIVYGGARLIWGDEIDGWIDENWGYR